MDNYCGGGECQHQDNKTVRPGRRPDSFEDRVKRALHDEKSLFQQYAEIMSVEIDYGDTEVN